MAPTLRSSPMHGGTGIDTTPTKSPRKVPHCSKCQRPRAGHPRQGCPYAEPESPNAQTSPLDITSSMDSLSITPVKAERRSSRLHPPARDPTLASISSESSVILNRLCEPGSMNDALITDEDAKAGIFAAPSTPKHSPYSEGRIMPGTLLTPRSSLEEVPAATQADQYDDHLGDDSSSKSSLSAGTARPLARTMSVEERVAFLDGLSELSHSSPTSVYSISAGELNSLAESAAKLGFCTGIVFPQTGTVENGLLILGRDSRAVNDLVANLAREAPKQTGIRAIAGGAVAGAVATFTGLALA
ncbi:hypothetical protein BC834DRAFT_678352 [Gloeopeniophorella convolvens]|nr:hypothetical protein BC834DRAFT_678352 [Gloeopeniophorella convolvens]